MRFLKDEEGQVLPFTALCLVLLMGCMALSADVGVMFYDRRNAQTAADAAAVAGALDYQYNQSISSAQAAAWAASQKDGFTNGANGTTVTVNPPPLSGPEQGVPGYVEVIISQVEPTFFARVLGKNSVTVQARAVAGVGGGALGCFTIDNLSPWGQLGIAGSGVGNLNTGCAVNDGGRLTLSGTDKISGTTIADDGDTECGDGTSGANADCATMSTGTSVTNNGGTVVNPLAALTAPADPGTPQKVTLAAGSTPSSLLPNTAYTLTVPTQNPVNWNTATTVTVNLSTPGVYFIDGINDQNPSNGNINLNIVGSGVTIIMNEGSIATAANLTWNLTAPTSSPLTGVPAGMALWIPTTNPEYMQMSGLQSGSIKGTIYAATSYFAISTSGSLILNSNVILGGLSYSGNLTVNNTPGLPGGSGGNTGTFAMAE
jgi:hypothetical protein